MQAQKIQANNRAQAGLEYLLTYGWALILIASVIGVLVFIVSSPASTTAFSSSDPTKILVKGGTIEGTQATIKLQNITGGKIEITSISGEGSLSGCAIGEGTIPFTVAAGSQFTLTCTASGSSTGTATINYTDYAGLQRSVGITASEGTSEAQPECTNGQTRQCGTTDIGECQYGTETCTGGIWGACEGAINPTIETCTGNLDEDCDNLTDCLDPDCSAEPACIAGLVGYWKFENNANDEKGANNGIINGTPQFVSGAKGQALDFDGDGDYVNIGTSTFGSPTSLTISLWIKTKQAAAEADSFIARGQYAYPFHLKMFGTDDVRWLVRTTNTSSIFSTANMIPPGTWHHIVGVFDGTGAGNGYRIYINAIQRASGTAVSGSLNWQSGESTNIAKIPNNTTDDFPGLIDEVMIFNRALGVLEIAAIYNAQKPQ